MHKLQNQAPHISFDPQQQQYRQQVQEWDTSPMQRHQQPYLAQSASHQASPYPRSSESYNTTAQLRSGERDKRTASWTPTSSPSSTYTSPDPRADRLQQNESEIKLVKAPKRSKSSKNPKIRRGGGPRSAIPLETRRSICVAHQKEPHLIQTQLGAMFDVDRTTICKILKAKDKLLALPEGPIAPVVKQKGKCKIDAVKALANWAKNQERERRVPITDAELRAQAHTWASTTQDNVDPGFWTNLESQDWLEEFKTKHSIGNPDLVEAQANGSRSTSQFQSYQNGVKIKADLGNQEVLSNPAPQIEQANIEIHRPPPQYFTAPPQQQYEYWVTTPSYAPNHPTHNRQRMATYPPPHPAYHQPQHFHQQPAADPRVRTHSYPHPSPANGMMPVPVYHSPAPPPHAANPHYHQPVHGPPMQAWYPPPQYQVPIHDYPPPPQQHEHLPYSPLTQTQSSPGLSYAELSPPATISLSPDAHYALTHEMPSIAQAQDAFDVVKSWITSQPTRLTEGQTEMLNGLDRTCLTPPGRDGQGQGLEQDIELRLAGAAGQFAAQGCVFEQGGSYQADGGQ